MSVKWMVVVMTFSVMAWKSLGLKWTTEALHTNSCEGQDTILLWNYSLETNETVQDNQWFFQSTQIAYESESVKFLVSPLYKGRVERIGKMGILLKNVSSVDTGNYSLYLNLGPESPEIMQTIFLTVFESRTCQCKPSITKNPDNVLFCTTNSCGGIQLSTEWRISETFYVVSKESYLEINSSWNAELVSCCLHRQCQNCNFLDVCASTFIFFAEDKHAPDSGYTENSVNLTAAVIVVALIIFFLTISLVICVCYRKKKCRLCAMRCKEKDMDQESNSEHEAMMEGAMRCKEKDIDQESNSEHEAMMEERIQQQYGGDLNEGELHQVEFLRGNGALGLSLADNKDHSKMSVFVAGIQPDSIVARDGQIQVGDELLEDKTGSGTEPITISTKSEGKTPGSSPISMHDVIQVIDLNKNGNLSVGDQILEVADKPLIGVPYDKAIEILSNVQGTMRLKVRKVGADNVLKDSSSSQNIQLFNVPGESSTDPPTESGTNQAPDDESVDPLTCPIIPGKETVIEIEKDRTRLGLNILGGADSLLVGDENLREASLNYAKDLLRQTPSRVPIVVFHDDTQVKDEDIYDVFTVELMKNPGKKLGLDIISKRNDVGVYISKIVKGGVAEADGRLIPGDQIMSVNGEDMKNSTLKYAAHVLKTSQKKVTLTVGRLKAGSKASSRRNSQIRVLSQKQVTSYPTTFTHYYLGV